MENSYSIIDVAKAAGVGVGTVSRVLNDAPNVNPETAAQVHAAVAKLGYRLPARSKRRGPRWSRPASNSRGAQEILVAILGPQGLDWVLQCAPVFSGVLHGIEADIMDRGHVLTMKQAASWQQLASGIGNNLPAGLIILGYETGLGSRSELSTAFQQIPTVWTMGSPLDFRGDHVQPDHMKIGIQAAEHVLRRGFKRCAVIGTKPGCPGYLVGFRNDAFRWSIEQHGGKVEMLLSPDLIRVGVGLHEVNGAVMAQLVAQLVNLETRPEAIFLEGDILAPALYQRLAVAGVQPQTEMEIVTCNNERPYLSPLDPKPTIIDVQAQIIGRRAVGQLIWRMANLHAPAMRVLVEPVLVPSENP